MRLSSAPFVFTWLLHITTLAAQDISAENRMEDKEDYYNNTISITDELELFALEEDGEGEELNDDIKIGGLRGSLEENVSCSAEKKVTLYKFCIDGDCDAGAEGEHRLKLDGHWLWSDFRDFREGQCHNINVGSRNVGKYKSLTVGTEEHDDWSENDSWFATMPSSKWYSPTCGTYEITLAKQFASKKEWSSCFTASATATYNAISGTLTSETCAKWTQPAQSFIWYLKVEPQTKTITPSDTLHGTSWHPSHKLGRCEGDCDYDSDCSGNLQCFHRNGYESVPGCKGQGTYSMDYCIGGGGTCGNGKRGDGKCADGRCCSRWGWCGSSWLYCKK
jgi:hypothetical protein